MKAKIYKFENLMAGTKFEIRNECARCFDLYIKLANSDRFKFVDTYRNLEEAKAIINL